MPCRRAASSSPVGKWRQFPFIGHAGPFFKQSKNDPKDHYSQKMTIFGDLFSATLFLRED
jgi:hypothetical protein